VQINDAHSKINITSKLRVHFIHFVQVTLKIKYYNENVNPPFSGACLIYGRNDCIILVLYKVQPTGLIACLTSSTEGPINQQITAI
jgi:hypothetical protein